jgi:two-component system, NtrC family, nitrogen regulation response regulator GlnG
MDDSTLTGTINTFTGTQGLGSVPALTILLHPDLDRAGHIAPLMALVKTHVAHVNRDEPIFCPPGSSDGQSIDHRRMSHRSVIDIVAQRGSLELRRGETGSEIEVDGRPLDEPRRITAGELRRGVIITVARRFVFCLHPVQFPISRSPTLGLLGTSDGIENVRRAIIRAADKTMSVLLRGESGTGKELAARALHDSGRRATRPFVVVNTANLTGETAVAELFGHQKGAFTGADSHSLGHFRSAEGGTIFLDEVGYLEPKIQPKLLRVLENGGVQAKGSSLERKVDVRIIAATDANLEQAVAAGSLEKSLYQRFNSSFNIHLPPLRERREDVGVLLVHYLRAQFDDPARLQRLQNPDSDARPWISARDVAAIARSSLSGNVRTIKALAEQLVTDAAGDDPRAAHAVIVEFLAKRVLSIEEPAAPPAPSRRTRIRRAPGDVTQDQLLSALEKAGWNRTRAAGYFNVSRNTFWRWLLRYPDLRKVSDLSFEELQRDLEICGGDVDKVAGKLGVPSTLVVRRLAARP